MYVDGFFAGEVALGGACPAICLTIRGWPDYCLFYSSLWTKLANQEWAQQLADLSRKPNEEALCKGNC